MKYYTV